MDMDFHRVGVVPMAQILEVELLGQKVNEKVVLLDSAKFTSIKIIPICISTRKVFVSSYPYQ